MSRQIDTSDLSKLSEEELLYLADRGRLTAEQEAEYGIKPSRRGGRQEDAPTLGDNTGDVGTADGAPIVGGSVPNDGSDEPVPPYEEWSKKDLQAEIDRRNEDREEENKIPRSGTIAELADRLTEDDNEG